MLSRLARPLNQAAIQQADAQIYARHAADPRPNPLYDAEGLRRPLDPDDPAQAALRAEWVSLYSQALANQPGGAQQPSAPPQEPPGGGGRPPGSTTEACPGRLQWIQIQLLRKPDVGRRPAYWPAARPLPYGSEPYNGGFTNGSDASDLDSQGIVRKTEIPCGSCNIRFPEFYNTIEQYFREQLR